MESTVRAGAGYEAARAHRAELRHAVSGFADAVAAAGPRQAWRARAAVRLARLRDQLSRHVDVTEGPQGLYAELLRQAPRLHRPVSALADDHRDLAAAVDALSGWLDDPERSDGEVRGAAHELLAAFAAHRQRGADLIYEAYAIDIGGET
jgi:hypothetical protein